MTFSPVVPSFPRTVAPLNKKFQKNQPKRFRTLIKAKKDEMGTNIDRLTQQPIPPLLRVEGRYTVDTYTCEK